METPSESMTEKEPSGGGQGPPLCRRCGCPEIELGWFDHFCADCRKVLAERPLPVGIQLAGVLVIFAASYAITLSPDSLKAGIAFERGRRAEESGQYSVAVEQYQKALERYPESSETIAHLGLAYFHNKQLVKAAEQFRKLHGLRMDPKLAKEVNAAIVSLEASVDAEDDSRSQTGDRENKP